MNALIQSLRWGVGITLLFSSLAMVVYGLSQSSYANDDEREHDKHESREHRKQDSSRSPQIKAMAPEDLQARNDYIKECGSCHLAYPAKFLPAASWATLMSRLENHFGESAELPAPQIAYIARYLVTHSAQPGDRKLKLLGQTVPLRITELPYFIRKHDEIPARMVTGNAEVGSFSQCEACHLNADRGDFDEDRVVIPGYARQHF